MEPQDLIRDPIHQEMERDRQLLVKLLEARMGEPTPLTPPSSTCLAWRLARYRIKLAASAQTAGLPLTTP